MSDRADELGTGTHVVVVTFTDPSQAAEYSAAKGRGLRVLIDPSRDTYRRYGLRSGTFTEIWGLKVARRYYEILRARGLSALQRPTEDTSQLGGDFVIDRDGKLVYGFWSEGPADRPNVDELARAIAQAG